MADFVVNQDVTTDQPVVEVSVSAAKPLPPGVTISQTGDAEIMAGADAPHCEMPIRTYRGPISCLVRLLTAPLTLPLLAARLAGGWSGQEPEPS